MKLAALALASCGIAAHSVVNSDEHSVVLGDVQSDIIVDPDTPVLLGTPSVYDGLDHTNGYNIILEFSPQSETGTGRRLKIEQTNEDIMKQAEYNKLLPTRRQGLQTNAQNAFNEYTVPSLIRKFFNGAFVSFYKGEDFPELIDEDKIVSVESLNGIGIHIVNFKTKEDADDFYNRNVNNPAISFIEHEQMNYASVDTVFHTNEEAIKATEQMNYASGDIDFQTNEEAIKATQTNSGYDSQQSAFTEVPLPDDNEQEEAAAANEFVPNDPYFVKQWGMRQTNGIDMKASVMWKTFPPESSLATPIIAVLDSGTDIDHPDLVDRLWVNWAEYYGKPGVDDDGNGYIDDINGFNFVTMTPNINEQTNTHGTHCAGSILATGNNSEGIAGGFYLGKLMTAQMLNSSGTGPSTATARAVNYASGNGAHIASCSWTGGFTTSMNNTLSNSPLLHVCAAGNGGRSVDTDPRYPAGYTATHNNVMSIGAMHTTGAIASFSNYGAKNVDIFAPGTYITSTCIGGIYCSASGTSMATPNAAGIAAALYAKGMSMAQAVGAPTSLVGPFAADIKQVLVDTATVITNLVGLARSNGMVNGAAAMDEITSLIQSRIDLIKVDCVVGAWSAWNTCSASCGTNGGTQTRTRTLTPPVYGGAACPATTTQTQTCNKGVACPVDCVVGSWSAWNTCSASCGTNGGTQTRTRTLTPPQNGGAACPSESAQTQVCNKGVACPVDCVVGSWSSWSTCSATCGVNGGTQSRTRSLTPPKNGGAACPTDSTQTQTCNSGVPCAVDCIVGAWSDWSACSATCGVNGGNQSRTRHLTPPQNGGAECPSDSVQNQVCNKGVTCPDPCALGDWGDWGSCSATCGTATKQRTRTSVGPNCVKTQTQVTTCSGLPSCKK